MSPHNLVKQELLGVRQDGVMLKVSALKQATFVLIIADSHSLIKILPEIAIKALGKLIVLMWILPTCLQLSNCELTELSTKQYIMYLFNRN